MIAWERSLLFDDDAMSAKPLIIGHRGASYDAPENTLAAFRLAFEQGADGIEGDFDMTADDEVVCFHDRTAQRTAGVDRLIASMSLEEIRQLDVGSWKGKAFANERVPTLGEVIEWLPAGKVFFVEIKSGGAILPALERVLANHHDRLADLRFICFDDETIAAIKRAFPAVKAFWLTSFQQQADGQITPSPEAVVAKVKELKVDGVDADSNLYRHHPDLIAAMHNNGFESHTWTVDDPVFARELVELGIDSITTNRPAFIRKSMA